MNIFHWPQEKKITWAFTIAIIFHAVGLIGILWIDPNEFADMTPLNLLLSVALIFWTQEKINIPFIIFLAISFCAGLITEYLGVNYQLFFGHYRYETALGPKIGGVPWVIGLNWFMVIYCCGITVQMLLNMVWNKLRDQELSERVSLYDSFASNAGSVPAVNVVSAIKKAAAPTIILFDVPRVYAIFFHLYFQ